MTEVLQLINKHRGSGLLVDTNLLLLYLIGRTNKNRILNFKRNTHGRLRWPAMTMKMGMARFSARSDLARFTTL
jgi:hypothetical protein